jgi:hypothetical protein
MTTRRHLWASGNITLQNVFKVLQYGAKVHEILILTSFSWLVLHFVRRRLVGGGMSLGVLLGAYKLSSVLYIFSAQF